MVESPLLSSLLREDILVEVGSKRFEYTYEAMWKALKEVLRSRGIECYSPKGCLQEGLKEGLVPEEWEETLAQMVKLRNELVHIYDEERAQRLYQEISRAQVLQAFQRVLDNLKKAIATGEEER